MDVFNHGETSGTDEMINNRLERIQDHWMAERWLVVGDRKLVLVSITVEKTLKMLD